MILGLSSQSLRHVYQKEASRKTGKRGELLQISVAFFDVSHWLGALPPPCPEQRRNLKGQNDHLKYSNWIVATESWFMDLFLCFSYGAWCA